MDVVALGLAKADAKKNYSKIRDSRARALLELNRARSREIATVPAGITIAAPNTGATAITGTTTIRTGNDVAFRYTTCRLADQAPGAPRLDAGTGLYSGRQIDFNGGGDPQPYFVDYMIDSLDHEFRFSPNNSKSFFKIWMDGQKVAGPTSGGTVGAFTRQRITAAVKQPRHIRIQMRGMFFAGVTALTVDSLWRPQFPLYNARVGIICDSYGAGAQDPQGHTFVNEVADQLRWEVLPIAQSGTGYVNNNGGANSASVFGARPAMFVGEQLDALVFVGSQNDDSYVGSLQAAAAAAYANAATHLPGVPVFVIGPNYLSSAANTTRDANTAAVQAAALAAPNVAGFISPKGWITGTGKEGAPVGDGNADIYVASEPIPAHPNGPGHRYFGQRCAEALAALWPTA